MPTRIFAITAARETVTLDNEGRAEVSFTASNTGPKPIAGQAKLVALGSAKAAWLSLDGEQERNFAKGEAHQLSVHIAVPPGTPVGKYSFRLNIISVENPDDEFTEGPSVSFEVKELTVAQAPARKFPWWIVAVAAVVVLGAGIMTWLLIPQKVTMPDVVGRPYKEAVNDLNAVKLKPTAEEKVSGTQKPGIVIEQNPKAKEVVRVGTEVKLVVEVPPATVAVPQAVGQTISKAKDLFKEKDLAYEEAGKRITGKSSPGVVVEQNPPEGTNVPPGTKVAVIVEAKWVQVPGLIGQSPAQVELKLKEAQLQLKTEAKSAGARPGTIVDQNPKKDARVAPGTVVTAFVQPEPEVGSIEVPNLIGKTVNQSLVELHSRQLRQIIDFSQYPKGIQMNMGDTVYWQSPEPLVRVNAGAEVTIRAK
jgi:beta-lactam-binding protein with PASTA domain